MMKSWIDVWATLDYGELSYPVRLQLSKVTYYAVEPEHPHLVRIRAEKGLSYFYVEGSLDDFSALMDKFYSRN